jgi:predicted methyltransferase
LEFFGVEADDTVVELWPGGGWYTSILAPYLKEGGGKLIAAGFDPESSDFAKRMSDKYKAAFVEQPEKFGEIEMTVSGPSSEGIAAPESADVVLTFRNVHNWMKSGFNEKMFADAYAALKPGGVLGVVEHRLPSAAVQDPQALSGYVQESFVIQVAKEAGFEFDGSSGVNSNPKDTADHPFGVWTLPPVSRSPEEDDPEFDAQKYLDIGESDRMTLKFIKPVTADE